MTAKEKRERKALFEAYYAAKRASEDAWQAILYHTDECERRAEALAATGEQE